MIKFKYISIIFTLILFLSMMKASAQSSMVSIFQSGQAAGLSTWKVNLINHSAEPMPVVIKVSIIRGGARLYQNQTRTIQLNSGNNPLDLSNIPGIQNPAVTLNNNPELPSSGDNQICVEVYTPKFELLASDCQLIPVETRMPPHLVFPFDRDELESPMPVFTWTPPGPMKPGQPLSYTIKVVEIPLYQTAKTAINSAPAFLYRENLSTNVHPYNLATNQFEVGKWYAWQIEAFSGLNSLGKSEIWSFTLGEEGETPAEEEENGPYVELRRKYDAGFYHALGKIKFRFDKEYGEDKIDFVILTDTRKAIDVKYGRLKQIGDNRFILDLPPGSGLQEGKFYSFEITNAKGEVRKLRFKYYYPRS